MKNRNWFWGFFFLISAVFVIASQTGAFGQIGLMSLVATILLAALIISSLISRNFFGVFVPLAFLYIIYRQPLGLVDVALWLLILASALASIGFSILFPSRPKDTTHCHRDFEGFSQTSENIDDNHPYAKVSFGSSSKYLHADALQSGQFIVSFGELEVYFDQVQLSPEGSDVFLDCSFGSIKLFIPKQWQVVDNMHVSLGDVKNNTRLSQPCENAPRLTLSGNVQLGDVEIQYI